MEPNLPDVVLWSIPAFVLLTVIEMVSYRLHPDEDAAGYETKDAATSVTMGLGSLGFDLLWKIPILAIYMGVYELTPLRVPVVWWTVLLMLLAQDFFYYWSHRGHHVIRILWACHVVHHSSEKFNLTTALRQPWTSATVWPFYLPLIACGVHRRRSRSASRPTSSTSSGCTPSGSASSRAPSSTSSTPPPTTASTTHSQGGYLDRNYGGILIIWDRMFGSFAAEVERPVYGLTKNISTHNSAARRHPRVRSHRPGRPGRRHLERAGRPGSPRPGLAAGGEGGGEGGSACARSDTRAGRGIRTGPGLRSGTCPVTATAARPGSTGTGGRAERFARPVLLAFLLVAAADLAGLLAGAETVHLIAKPLLMPLLCRVRGAARRTPTARRGPAVRVGRRCLPARRQRPGLPRRHGVVRRRPCLLPDAVRAGEGRGRAPAPLVTGAGYAVVLVVFLVLIWPDLPADLRIPLTGYSLLLTAMAWRAGVFGPYAAVGGAFFLLSDALIATGIAEWPQAPAPDFWVMLTYIAAQALLTLGVLGVSAQHKPGA